jgi:hypothetical protein
MKTLSLLSTTALLLTPAFSLGINCFGSFQCGPILDPVMSDIANVIVNQIDRNRFYNNGEHIACAGIFCAFLQNSGGAPGSSIVPLIQDLRNHGCKVCGSVPLFFPQGDNNVRDGELTVNAAEDDACIAKSDAAANLC